MTNNDIFKKLRVALHLRNDDIIRILKHVDFEIPNSSLQAVFQKEDHPNYRDCGDQLLRNFLNGLIIEKRGPMPDKKAPIKPVEKKVTSIIDSPLKKKPFQSKKSDDPIDQPLRRKKK